MFPVAFLLKRFNFLYLFLLLGVFSPLLAVLGKNVLKIHIKCWEILAVHRSNVNDNEKDLGRAQDMKLSKIPC